MKRIIIIAGLFFSVGISSCSKFLDIVPDNVATIENAFTMRSTAERYLFTCYSYLPHPGSLISNPGFLAGSIWPLEFFTGSSSNFVRGRQNKVTPYLNYWDGLEEGKPLFKGIRDCNIFIENISRVPDMPETEKKQWEAEAKFLKAYYHFFLVQCYGPIPIIRESLPIDAEIDEVRVSKEPVDTCFNYIVSLIDEAIPDLSDFSFAQTEPTKYGRINKAIAMSLKAWVLVTAASPLFNGNTDYADYVDKKNGVLFNQQFDLQKWKKAMDASREAIQECERIGIKLFKFQPGPAEKLSDSTIIKMNIRNAIADRTSEEIIWAYTNAWADQTILTPRTWDPDRNLSYVQGRYGPSLDIVELFYTDHGVPINEDKYWDYQGRYNIKVAGEEDRYYIAVGYETVAMHFGREPRFHASTGFDGGIWYGQGKYDDLDSWHLEGRAGGYTSAQYFDRYSPTGYWPKKLINYKSVIQPTSYASVGYLFPYMRLADLYLLYAEASNEYQGPNQEALMYLNRIRERAGIPSIEDSWSQYSKIPNKYESKEGFRDIIHREREIELVYEGKRYWDLLRWKKAEEVLNTPVVGWALRESKAELYYQPTVVFERQFRKRDYFMPIRESNIIRNKNLLQSPGW